jgi:predicted ATPase/DNA-binding winged helix-turn-helix (wHTH) protein
LLVERAGHVVSKEEIVARVWPGIVTVEGNLRVQISGLRKSLRDGEDGNRYILNVSNRGYSFIEPVRRVVARSASRSQSNAANSAPHNIPVVQGRVIGRQQACLALIDRILEHRLVTLVGAGGVGKTTLAIATVPPLLERREVAAWQGAYFVDLSPLSDPHLISSTIATTLGVDSLADNALNGVVSYLRDKELLLLIDNCEHLAGEVVRVCEAILGNAPKVRILATSREPLRMDGERVQILRPLAIPAEGLSAAQAITYSAVELFVERARARAGAFTLRDDMIDAIVGICRRLDGIPLAIEMASARVDCLGVGGLATALDEMFAVLTKGRRTALQRHQTLYAAIDWSFNLLGPREQSVLRRLSVFSGAFTIEAAVAVAACSEYGISDVVESLCDLVDRSLITSDVNQSETFFRLLETTRAYARRKLRDVTESAATSDRHAQYCLEILGEAELARARNDLAGWYRRFGWLIDDVRAALDWTFSPRGDSKLGLSLTFAALPLWFQQSLMAECGGRIQQALSALESAGPGQERAAAKLHTALACVLSATPGKAEDAQAAWTIAYQLAEGLGDVDYTLRNLWGLWAAKMIEADFQSARGFADRFCNLAGKSSDSSDCAVGQRLLAASLHFLGDQEGALHHIEQMLARYRAPSRRAHVARYQFDQLVTASIARSRSLWVLGRGDAALSTLDASVEDALATGHKLSLCNTLMQAACPVALLAGDLARAERFTELLRRESERSSLGVWHLFAGCFQGQILVKRGEVQEGLSLIHAAIENQNSAGHLQYFVSFHLAYAEGLLAANADEDASAVLETALARANCNNEHWATAELLRLKGQIAIRAGDKRSIADAERLLGQSFELATRQKALSWQLRTAISFFHLRRLQGRCPEGRELLASTHGAFREGHDQHDLVVAKSLLDALGD